MALIRALILLAIFRLFGGDLNTFEDADDQFAQGDWPHVPSGFHPFHAEEITRGN